MTTKTIGILAVLGAALVWAIEPVLSKLSFYNATFIQTVAIRGVIITFLALIYTLITNKRDLKINKTSLAVIAYIAILGTVIGDGVYLYSLTKIPVINAALITHLQPIFIVLIGFFILKEDKLTKFDYVGIFLMLIAALFVTTKTAENFSNFKFGTKTDFLLLTSTVIWSTTVIAARKYLRELNAGVLVFYRFLIGSIVFITYLILTKSLVISNIYQIMLGIITAAGIILFYEGLRRIKAAQASSIELVAPFFAALFGFLILGEKITLIQIAGMILLAFGVYFLSKKEQAET